MTTHTFTTSVTTTEIKGAVTENPVLPLIKSRWSPRSFSGQPLSQEAVNTLLEAGTWAFSAMNEQPWRFYVGLKGTPAFDQLHATLMDGNKPWAIDAGALILCAYSDWVAASERPNGAAQHDLGAANMLIALQGQSMGIYTHVLGGFHKDAAKALLPDDEHLIPAVVLAVGYLDEADKLAEPFRSRELTPRTRKPLSEVILNG